MARSLRRLLVLGATSTLLALAGCASTSTSTSTGNDAAAGFPERPITGVVPYPAGGSADAAARLLAKEAGLSLGVSFDISNREGGSGTVGAASVVSAQPDGYTVGFMTQSILALQPQLTAGLPWQGIKDYEPVINVVSYDPVLVVRSDASWSSLDELVEYGKSNAGKVRVGSSGVGGIFHIALEGLKKAADIDLTHVPFKGTAPAVTALLGGHIDAIVASPSDAQAHVASGDLKILASFGAERGLYPDIPTAKELGYDVTQDGYYPVILPAGTPEAVVDRLHDALKKAAESDEFKKFAEENGLRLAYEGPEELAQHLERDEAYFKQVVSDNVGLRPTA